MESGYKPAILKVLSENMRMSRKQMEILASPRLVPKVNWTAVMS